MSYVTDTRNKIKDFYINFLTLRRSILKKIISKDEFEKSNRYSQNMKKGIGRGNYMF